MIVITFPIAFAIFVAVVIGGGVSAHTWGDLYRKIRGRRLTLPRATARKKRKQSARTGGSQAPGRERPSQLRR